MDTEKALKEEIKTLKIDLTHAYKVGDRAAVMRIQERLEGLL